MTKQEILNILQHGDYIEFSKLDIFEINIGHLCNQRCIHCYQGENKDDDGLRFESILKIIDSFSTETALIFTGGEPTVRDNFLQIVRYAKEKGHIVIIKTNATKFSDIAFLSQTEKYVDIMLVAFHSKDAEMYDIISGSKQGEKFFEAIENLYKSKVHIITNTVINKINYTSLVDILDLIKKLVPDVLKMSLTFAVPTGFAKSDKVVVSYREAKDFIFKAIEKYKSEVQTHYIPICYLYPYQDIVRNLDLMDNNTHDPGIDYIDGKWSYVDFLSIEEGMKIKSKHCKSCVFDNICSGVWSEYKLFYDFNKDAVPIKGD